MNSVSWPPSRCVALLGRASRALVSRRSRVRIPLKSWFFRASSFQLLKLGNLIVGIHTSVISILLFLLMSLGWSLTWIASLSLRVYQWGSRSINLALSSCLLESEINLGQLIPPSPAPPQRKIRTHAHKLNRKLLTSQMPDLNLSNV